MSESPDGPRLELRIAESEMGGTLEGVSGDLVTASARVEGAQGDLLRWVGSEGVLRETIVDTDDFVDEWRWRVGGPYMRLEVIAKASLPFFEAELVRLEQGIKMPKHLSSATILDHPWRRALSNPVYVG